MSNCNPVPEGKDPILWAIARRRAGFRHHAITYVIVNLFLWAIWYLTGGRFDNFEQQYPWPIWSTLGWGIGLAFQYASAYVFHNENAVEQQYNKLKNNQ